MLSLVLLVAIPFILMKHSKLTRGEKNFKQLKIYELEERHSVVTPCALVLLNLCVQPYFMPADL